MATNNTDQAKSAKEELLAFLKRSPKVYTDAVKLTVFYRDGLSFSSLYKDSKVDRESILRELRQDDFFRVACDPKGGSDIRVYLTEKGRDGLFDVFYSKKEKRLLMRLLRKLDSGVSSSDEKSP